MNFDATNLDVEDVNALSATKRLPAENGLLASLTTNTWSLSAVPFVRRPSSATRVLTSQGS